MSYAIDTLSGGVQVCRMFDVCDDIIKPPQELLVEYGAKVFSLGRRTVPRTEKPSFRYVCATCAAMNPVTPVTRIVAGGVIAGMTGQRTVLCESCVVGRGSKSTLLMWVADAVRPEQVNGDRSQGGAPIGSTNALFPYWG